MNPGGSGPRDPWDPGDDDQRGDYGAGRSGAHGSGYGSGSGSGYGSGYGGGSGPDYGYQPGPWDAPPPQPPSGSPFLRVVVIIGLLLVIGVGACGACAFLGWRYAAGMIGDQVAESLRDNPVVAEHIGEIQSVKLDLMASGAEPEPEVFVFEVVGSRGRGRLIVQTATIDLETEEVLSGRLELEDGSVHDLFPDGREGASSGAEGGELQGPKK